MKLVYKNLSELKLAIDREEIDGSKLEIILDNDHTGYYYKASEHGSPTIEDEEIEITVKSAGNGWSDNMELYKTLFPESSINNC